MSSPGVVSRSVWAKQYAQRPEVKRKKSELAQQYWRDPEKRIKIEARIALRRAIKSGLVVRQPCEICGASPADAHHEDYSAPLVVRWFCRPCHANHHFAKPKSHCKRGHLLTEDNIRRRNNDGYIFRVCRICDIERARKYRRKAAYTATGQKGDAR